MVYIEYVLLVNALIHLIMIQISGIIINAKINNIGLFFSVILDGVYMYFYMIYPYQIEKISLFFPILLVYLSFIDFRNFIKGTLIYYLENFMLGGISYILYISMKSNAIIIIILVIINFIFTYIYQYKVKNKYHANNLLYEILIIDKNKKYYLKGFLDTGNFLKEEHMINIVFLNNKYQIGCFIKTLISNSINVKTEIKLFKVDEFYIKIDGKYIKKDVYIAYSNLYFDGMFGLDLLGG